MSGPKKIPIPLENTVFQQQFSLNVWAGVIQGQLLGPNILPPPLNGERYLNSLNSILFE
jgi:hypothetical protein